jgi:ABC-2 type transport system ATP-binding protein
MLYNNLKGLLASSLILLLVACGGEAPVASNSVASPNESAVQPAEAGSLLQVSDKKEELSPVVLRRVAGNPSKTTNVLAPSDITMKACTAVQPRSAGKAPFQVTLPSKSGKVISFQVFEPTKFDCVKGSPLVLHGHGFGGARETTASGLIGALVGNGYGVISIDQRGFGDSTGTVRVLDPEFEGKDLLQIMDWAEKNLDWVSYDERPDLEVTTKEPFNIVAGAIGGSYGGGYQLLLHNIDTKLQRLDVLSPDITWNDLRYSLNPGNVVKTGWDLLLVAGGESGGIQPKLQKGNVQDGVTGGLDMAIRETLVRGASANAFPDGALEFFRYHSADYFCNTSEVAGKPSFGLDPLFPSPEGFSFAQKKPAKIDILFTQGRRDTLFNFNEAWRNFKCYSSLGGDVRLMTHESGHILPASASALNTQPGIGAVLQQASAMGNISLPKFQEAAGPQACGGLSVDDATFAFFEEKLQRKPASAKIEALKDSVCMSLSADAKEAVYVPKDRFVAPAVKNTEMPGVSSVAFAGAMPMPQGVAAVAAALVNPVAMPVQLSQGQLSARQAGDLMLAGIPVLKMKVSSLFPVGNPTCTQYADAVKSSPVGVAGVGFACDPIVFLGVGLRKPGEGWRLVNDQVVPVRGLDTDKDRVLELNGISEKVAKDEEVAILAYGFHLQFPASFSRDVLLPAVSLAGKAQLPLFTNLKSAQSPK